MDQRLTIRPRMSIGESLASYMLRVAKLNSMEFYSLYKYVFKGEFSSKERILVYNLDLLPSRVVNINNFTKVLNIDKEVLHLMTMASLFKKFAFDPCNIQQKEFQTVTKFIETKYRKFCPHCLAETKIYKSIWQIKEIEICDIHKVNLSFKCLECKKPQPYMAESLANCRCKYCNSLLKSGQSKSELDDNFISSQLKVYEDWKFLINPQTSLSKQTYNLNSLKVLAAKILYMAQSKEETYSLSRIKNIEHSGAKKLRQFIRGEGKGQDQPTIFRVFQIARILNISIEEFSKTEVPNSYLESLLTKKVDTDVLDRCLTPWCSSFETNKDIKKIPYNSAASEVSNEYICNRCYFKFTYILGKHKIKGVSNSQRWYNVDNKIELITKVKTLLEQGLSQSQICDMLKINDLEFSEAEGYLAYHKIYITENYRTFFSNKGEFEDFLNTIEKLEGRLWKFKLAFRKIKKFGWGLKEFSFYFASEEVKSLILQKRQTLSKNTKVKWNTAVLSEIKKMEVSGEKIGVQSVANKLNVNILTLRLSEANHTIRNISKKKKNKDHLKLKEEYWNKAKEFFESYANSEQLLTTKECLKKIGTYRRWCYDHDKNLLDWINIKVKEHNSKIRLIKHIQKFKDSIDSIISRGDSISLTRVIDECGFHHSVLKKYPELKDFIFSEFESLTSTS